MKNADVSNKIKQNTIQVIKELVSTAFYFSLRKVDSTTVNVYCVQ
jgi:hypothetical protein